MPVTIARNALSGFAVGAAVAFALSACSPSDGAESSSSAAASTSTSQRSVSPTATSSGNTGSASSKPASPTPIAASSDGPAKNWPVPKMPAEAKKHTLEGAAAFSKHYFKLIEYTWTTNETAPLSKVSSRNCEVCQDSLIEPAQENKKNGGWNTGGKFHPTISSAQKEDQEVWVTFKVSQDDSYVYDPDKVLNRILHATPEPVPGSFFLEWHNGWRMNAAEMASP